jgi:transposase InsO family protein
MEQTVLTLRAAHPVWGGRKIRARLTAQGCGGVPAASTITAILRRHDQIDPQQSTARRSCVRFERPAPNDLWQMDFKGHIGLRNGARCHPLTVLDDHSRFAVALRALQDEQGKSVQAELIETFRRYGLPAAVLTDNGPPWGGRPCGESYTPLAVWLIRLGIGVLHGRAYHPQTQGKEERFHRTLKAELLGDELFADLSIAQRRFDRWRNIYNFERPHEALGLSVPAQRYEPSPRRYLELLPPIEYGPDDAVRKVHAAGEIYFRGRIIRIGRAFWRQHIALRPTATDGLLDVFFCKQWIRQIDLRA